MRVWLTMSELDRRLGLARGTCNALRRKGVFEAEKFMGRLWAIDERDLPSAREAIETYRSGPEGDATITVKAAADRLKLAPSTIYNLVRLGRLISVPVPSGKVHVTVASIEHYRQTRLPVGVGIRLGRKHNG